MSRVEDHQVSFSYEIDTQGVDDRLRKLQSILYRVLGLMGRAGLPEDMEAQIRLVQRLIAWLNKLRLTLKLWMIARAAAGDPFAWAQLGVGVAELTFEMSDLQMET